MRTFCSALLATSLMVSSAFAGSLAPGKPAGVKEAQSTETPWIVIIGGLGIVGVGIGLAASGSSNSITSTSATSTSSTTTTTTTTG